MIRQKKCMVLTIVSCCLAAVPMEAENIKFADANVKAICVANWDKDNDGELSVEEAAAVTSLGTVFRGQKGITTFDELRYFTNVTVIDAYSFSESSIGPVLTIPGTVKQIGDNAFYNCNRMTTVVLEEGVESIGHNSFFGPVSTLVLPKSLQYMKPMSINPYANADPSSGIFIPVGDLTVITHSLVPAPVNEFAFYYVFGEGHLVVPAGCAETYKTAESWAYFADYIEAGDVNRDGRLDIADVTLLIAFIQGRKHTETEARIADVNGDGVLDGEDVEQLCQYILGT